MEDMKKFLRYIMPGIVFLIAFCYFTLAMLFPLIIEDNYAVSLSAIIRILKTVNIGNAGVLVLLSTGFGYIFSIIFHQLYWKNNQFFTNFKKIINYVINYGLLNIKRRQSEKKGIDKDEAWTILNSTWSQLRDEIRNCKESYIGEKTHNRAEELFSMLHSLGASLIAAIFALFFSIFTVGYVFNINNYDYIKWSWNFLFSCLLMLIGVVIIKIIYCSCIRVKKLSQEFDESILIGALKKYKKKYGNVLDASIL